MRRGFYFLTAFAFLIAGCAILQRIQPPLKQEEPPVLQRTALNIIDYKNMDIGAPIPVWADLYLLGNASSIESLVEFENHYVFISVNAGTNFYALGRWNAAFSAELDFARLAALRIEKRMLEAAAKYPDDEYGSYFETLIRNASDAEWTGAVRMDDFWIYRSFPDPEDPGAAGVESYDFLILVIIDKETLAGQIRPILNNAVPDTPLTRDQRNAVNRVRERFFDGF